MRLNAELQRNLWLEVSWQRLIAVPSVLGGFYYLMFISADVSKSPLLYASFWVFLASAGLWGANQAENSLAVEVQAGTWPLQRLTSISPWSMTWGKLFGSTLFSWYIGLISLLVFVGTLFLFPEDELFPNPKDRWMLLNDGTPLAILSLIGMALLIQTAGFLNGFSYTQNKQAKAKGHLGKSLLSSLLLIGFFSTYSLASWSLPEPVLWFGRIYTFPQFLFYSMSTLLAWAVTAAYMQMRKEFQVDNPPWVWLGFMIFINVYIMGFTGLLEPAPTEIKESVMFRLLPGGAATVLITYLMLFWERADGVELRRLFHLIQQRRWRDAGSVVPRWSISAVLACGVGGALMVGFGWNELSVSLKPEGNFYAVVGAVLCFMMRDIALFLFLCFSDKPQRATATTLILLIIFYGQIPWMLNVAGFESLQPLFLPTGDPSTLVAVLPVFLQALALWVFTVKRWRKKFSPQAIG